MDWIVRPLGVVVEPPNSQWQARPLHFVLVPLHQN